MAMDPTRRTPVDKPGLCVHSETMAHLNFDQAISKIRATDSRFLPAAYHFIRQSLDHSIARLGRHGPEKKPAHVSGKELLEGFRDLALKEFGPMAKTVLGEWGIFRCAHVGEIVFQLVQYGILGKSETDKPDDFQEIWTFSEAFETPFQPKPLPPKKRSSVWRSPTPKKASSRRRQKSKNNLGKL
ncbi:MAG: hypothetical protein EBT57_05975 [Verrucomicrobia bacterium]|nr:hypothetical protein [Verrucomicrobiota bacterium]